MEFSASGIILAIFTGLISGLASYFGAYTKVKAEVRAATEDLEQTIQNLIKTTHAAELEKAKIASDSAIALDQRRTLYALVSATQAMTHSICWISWDIRYRRAIRPGMVAAYDSEVHKWLPEIFAQLAVLRLFDADLHARAYESISRLCTLDAQVGMALLKAETDNTAAIDEMSKVYEQSLLLYREIDFLFGGRLQLGGSEGQARALVGKSSEVSGSGRGPQKEVDAAVWASLQRCRGCGAPLEPVAGDSQCRNCGTDL